MININQNLPPGWAWTTIGGITQSIEKVNPTEGPDKGFYYIDISSIDNSTQKIVEPKQYRGADAPSRARQLIHARDVVFSTVRTYLKNIALVSDAYDGQIASTGFAILRANEAVLPHYLFYYSLTPALLNRLSEIQRGTSYPAVRDSDVREQPIPLAPLPEQRRIVAKLEALFTRLDAGVAALKRAQANLKRYKAAVLKAACEGRLVPQDPGDEPAEKLLARILAERERRGDLHGRPKDRAGTSPAPTPDGLPKLPKGWCWANLAQLKLFSLYGPRFSSNDYSEDGIAVLRTTDINEAGKVSLESAPRLPLSDDEYEKYKCEIGDLLVTRTGSIGTLAIFNDRVRSIPGAFLIQYRLLVPEITRWYIFYFLKSPLGNSSLVNRSAGVGRPNLNAPSIEAIPIPLPPLAEQRRIVAEVERRLSVVAEMETTVAHNLARAERLRQAILKRAFAGKLVAQDPADEPAERLLERIRQGRDVRLNAPTASAPIRPSTPTKKRRAK